MVNERMHVFSVQVRRAVVPERARASWIAQSTVALHVHAVDRFSSGIEQKPDPLLALSQGFLDPFLFADIPRNAEVADHAALAVLGWPHVQKNQEISPVAAGKKALTSPSPVLKALFANLLV